jgi:hypothetical protein
MIQNWRLVVALKIILTAGGGTNQTSVPECGDFSLYRAPTIPANQTTASRLQLTEDPTKTVRK